MSDRSMVILGAVVLAVGLALGGWFIGDGFKQSRLGSRVVLVKGLSERPVKADLAVWPIRFVATGNELSAVQDAVGKNAATVTAFLDRAGIPAEQIEMESLEVTDLLAQAYRQGPVESRFIVTQTLMVRSPDVDRIAATSQRVDELVDAGVVLSSQAGPAGTGPFYLFTRLTEIKPEMIAEGTRNARAAAAQFAEDSGSRLGGIKRANQGVFQILPRDKIPGMSPQNQIHKTVRVVSTIEYFLVD